MSVPEIEPPGDEELLVTEWYCARGQGVDERGVTDIVALVFVTEHPDNGSTGMTNRFVFVIEDLHEFIQNLKEVAK